MSSKRPIEVISLDDSDDEIENSSNASPPPHPAVVPDEVPMNPITEAEDDSMDSSDDDSDIIEIDDDEDVQALIDGRKPLIASNNSISTTPPAPPAPPASSLSQPAAATPISVPNSTPSPISSSSSLSLSPLSSSSPPPLAASPSPAAPPTARRKFSGINLPEPTPELLNEPRQTRGQRNQSNGLSSSSPSPSPSAPQSPAKLVPSRLSPASVSSALSKPASTPSQSNSDQQAKKPRLSEPPSPTGPQTSLLLTPKRLSLSEPVVVAAAAAASNGIPSAAQICPLRQIFSVVKIHHQVRFKKQCENEGTVPLSVHWPRADFMKHRPDIIHPDVVKKIELSNAQADAEYLKLKICAGHVQELKSAQKLPKFYHASTSSSSSAALLAVVTDAFKSAFGAHTSPAAPSPSSAAHQTPVPIVLPSNVFVPPKPVAPSIAAQAYTPAPLQKQPQPQTRPVQPIQPRVSQPSPQAQAQAPSAALSAVYSQHNQFALPCVFRNFENWGIIVRFPTKLTSRDALCEELLSKLQFSKLMQQELLEKLTKRNFAFFRVSDNRPIQTDADIFALQHKEQILVFLSLTP